MLTPGCISLEVTLCMAFVPAIWRAILMPFLHCRPSVSRSFTALQWEPCLMTMTTVAIWLGLAGQDLHELDYIKEGGSELASGLPSRLPPCLTGTLDPALVHPRDHRSSKARYLCSCQPKTHAVSSSALAMRLASLANFHATISSSL